MTTNNNTNRTPLEIRDSMTRLEWNTLSQADRSAICDDIEVLRHDLLEHKRYIATHSRVGRSAYLALAILEDKIKEQQHEQRS